MRRPCWRILKKKFKWGPNFFIKTSFNKYHFSDFISRGLHVTDKKLGGEPQMGFCSCRSFLWVDDDSKKYYVWIVYFKRDVIWYQEKSLHNNIRWISISRQQGPSLKKKQIQTGTEFENQRSLLCFILYNYLNMQQPWDHFIYKHLSL